jgi:hypothetical protein
VAATVSDNPSEHRFEISVDGALAGFARYSLHETRAVFFHTEVGKEFEGQGLASQLISSALDEARSRGWSVEPQCPFVRSYLARHTEYRDLVAPEQWARFGLDER